MKKEIGYYIYIADRGTKHQMGTVQRAGFEMATSARAALQQAKDKNTKIQSVLGKRRYRVYAEAA